jgi:hypothetical protein
MLNSIWAKKSKKPGIIRRFGSMRQLKLGYELYAGRKKAVLLLVKAMSLECVAGKFGSDVAGRKVRCSVSTDWLTDLGIGKKSIT